MAYTQTSTTDASALRKGDKVAAFKVGETIWSAEGGWAKASSSAGVVCGESSSGVPAKCPASGSVNFKIYEKGTYKLVLIKFLGHNEFGKSKGYSSSFSELGQVTVSCSGACATQPSDCVDTKTYCNQFISYCDRADRMTITSGSEKNLLSATCRKTCKLCDSGGSAPAVAPTGNCADTISQCSQVANYCPQASSMTLTLNGQRMKMSDVCKKTCNLCGQILLAAGDDWEEGPLNQVREVKLSA
jgi:hypothetical protein